MNRQSEENHRQRVNNQQPNTTNQPTQLYRDLGIQSNARPSEIKKAYYELARQWHPDRNIGYEGEATARFQQIALAYSVLSDPEKRINYDRSGTIGGKTIKHRKGRRKGTKYIKTNKKYKKKLPRKTIKKRKYGRGKKQGRKTRRIN